MSFNGCCARNYESEFSNFHPQLKCTAQFIFDSEMKNGVPREVALNRAVIRGKKFVEKTYGIKL